MKESLRRAYRQTIENKKGSLLQDPFFPGYHITAPAGWISDPNGLCQFQGQYHIFHQYTADAFNGLSKAWGHYVTRDWQTLQNAGVLMSPDIELDKDGCYSGSGFVHGETMHIFYTGNSLQEGNFDYINEGRGHVVLKRTSKDGIHFSEKKLILSNADYPDNMSCHVRDPKITKINDTFYMLLGARTKDARGCALVYTTRDPNLENFVYRQTLYFHNDPDAAFGYMWECPDLIEVGGEYFLITCPQGLKQQPGQFQNLHANGCFHVSIEKDGSLILNEFEELDYGFDFYAPQSFKDESGRQIMLGWVGMPDKPYEYPEEANGWIHCLTMPRQLVNIHHKLYQQPISEMKDLEEKSEKIQIPAGKEITLPVSGSSWHMHLDIPDTQTSLKLVVNREMEISWQKGIFSLDLKDAGKGRDHRQLNLENLTSLDLYCDHSVVEMYLNHGRHVLTSRIYHSQMDGDQSFYSSDNMEAVLASMTPMSVIREEPLQNTSLKAITDLHPAHTDTIRSETGTASPHLQA